MTREDRFLAKVSHSSSGCWTWVGAILRNGYGYFKGDERVMLAHRWSYEHFTGPIPEGLVLDHLCRQRNCVNPQHLEAVTQSVNLQRGANGFGGRTTCLSGRHDITDPKSLKTIRRSSGVVDRCCLLCSRERSNEAYARRKAIAV